MTDIKSALLEGKRLLENQSPSAQIDCEILLAFVLSKSRTFLYSHSDSILSAAEFTSYQQLISMRAMGQPIAYLIGTREFWSLPLCVSEHTLIPRPETELIVELILEHFATQQIASILDLGTGSGAIALALASERPQWKLTACDISLDALAVAADNAKKLKLSNVAFCISDWFSSVPKQKFDAIVANPPYLAEGDPHLLEGDLRFEPQSALVSGKNGMEALDQIITAAYDYLRPEGLLLVEHGFTQRDAIYNLFALAGYQNIFTRKDIQGNERVTGGSKFVHGL